MLAAHRSARTMSTADYKVAVQISLINNISKGLKLIGGEMLGLSKTTASLEGKLKALGLAATGLGLSRMGEGMLSFMGKAIDASKEYTHQIALMNAAGFTHKELAGSIAAAWKTTGSVITSTAAQNIEAIRELRSAFGKGEGMEHAYGVLPQVQRANAILTSLTGREQKHVGFDMVKAIELGTKGALTVDSMMRQSEMMTKALVQMGGTLSVSDFHQSLKYSRAMAPYMTDEFKYQYLPTLMQEMKAGPTGGASSAGNVIASLGQVVVGHMIPKGLMTNWIQSGLVNESMVVKDRHNRTTSVMLPGAVAGQNEFGQNPFFWAQRYAKPAVEKLMAELHLDQYGAILSLTHNRVASFGLQTLINKSVQFERDRKLIAEGPTTYKSYQTLLRADPEMAQKALHNQWQNVLSILGYQVLPKLLPLMVRFAEGLDRIAQVFAAHPTLASGTAGGLIGLGVGLDLLGKGLMGAGLIKFLGLGPMLKTSLTWLNGNTLGMIPVLLRGVGTGIMFLGRALFMNPIGLVIAAIAVAAYVLYRNWATVGPYVMKTWSIIKAVFHVSMTAIAENARAMWAVVGPYVTKAWSIIKALGSIVGSTFASIYTSITGWLGKILGWLSNSVIGKTIGFALDPTAPARQALGAFAGQEFNSLYKWSADYNDQYDGKYIRPGRASSSGKAGNVYLDGNLVGYHVAPGVMKRVGREANRPAMGSPRFDNSRGAMPVGLGAP
jgi:hypothetical protein